MVDLDGLRLLTDPILRDRVGPLLRVAPRVEPQAADGVDCILLSHLHADHTDLASLRLLPSNLPVLSPRGAGPWLRRKSVRDVRELSPGEEIVVHGVRIRAVPARHNGRRWPFGPEAMAIGYQIRGSTSVYFAGDTDLFPEMQELHESIDTALLPVAGWGPTLGPGHLDAARAVRALALIRPQVAIPIHWGTLAPMGLGRRPSRWDFPAREFAQLARRHCPQVDVRVLAPGATTSLPPPGPTAM